jgi:hypothetical protein
MGKSPLMLIVLTLGLCGFEAIACSLVLKPVDTRFSDAHSVTLAVPLGNTVEPKRALDETFSGEARQTVQWQVLVAWKGRYRAGDTLTTGRNLDIAPGYCQFLLRFQGQQPHLLYLFDEAPHTEFMALPPELSLDDLKYLEQRFGADRPIGVTP